jgi:molybdopterin synthase catalytic subunit
MKAELRHEALVVEEVTSAVAHAGAGAIDVFLGVVRATSEGRAVSRLEYQAYATMAEAEMGRIGREIEREIEGSRVAVVHRVGSLVVGELAVVCAASAPHRAEAFAACRALIDRIKARVPIWKREHGPDGAAWVGWVDARCGDEHQHEPARHSPSDHAPR